MMHKSLLLLAAAPALANAALDIYPVSTDCSGDSSTVKLDDSCQTIEVKAAGQTVKSYVKAKCTDSFNKVSVQSYQDDKCETKQGDATSYDIKGKTKDDCIKEGISSAKADCSAGSTATISMAVVAVAAFFMNM